jgi:tyrosyl-tRNA synthetase
MTNHTQAQELSVQAATTTCPQKARKLFAQAAELERKELNSIPMNKRITRSILAVSYISLLYKSKQLQKVKTEVRRLFAEGNLTTYGSAKLAEFIE